MMKRKLVVVGSAVSVLLLTLASVAEEKRENPRKRLVANNLSGPLLEVHFLDIGQGDAIYIRTPGGRHYMVDTGTRSSRRMVVPYLKYLKVEKLDGVLITHSHLDHVGGLFYIAEAIPIGTFYHSGYVHEGTHNEKTVARLKKKKVPFKKVRAGDVLELDQGVFMNVFHPPANWTAYDSELNDFSVVVKLTYGDIDFLLTGDAEKKSEKSMLKRKLALKSEFLKVGHHGSNTATTTAFLETVDPLYAIVSCGAGNKFKHPHPETMEALRKRDTTVLRTDQNGTIGVYTNGKRIMIKIKGKDWQPVSTLRLRQSRGGRLLAISNRGGEYA